MFIREAGSIFRNIFVNNSKWLRRNSVAYKALKYGKFGEPLDVLEIAEDCAEMPKDKEILIKILASPINPADVNTIQGKYPVKSKFPAVGGNEAVGEVVAVGDEVKNISVGHNVIFIASGLGTWRTHAVICEEHLMKVSKDIGLAEAATLSVNPCTAYRMLKDFAKLAPGDTVIQNGANSGVGQCVHQLCKAWDINSVGVVRNRPDIKKVKKDLKRLGATEIFTEEEIDKTTIFKDGKLKKPALALNCVGGPSALLISKHLDSKGVMVTFGGMSKKPVAAPTPSLIFKDIRFVGFWITRWNKEHANTPEQKSMLKDLCVLIKERKLRAPNHEFVPLAEFKKAEPALVMKNARKIIFKMK